jgi:hypothetical protein
VCHALLQDPNFFRLLLRADQELALEAKALLTAINQRKNLASTS